MRNLCGRRAFTLVELLVVITLIGCLIALLLPALTAALGYAERVECAANMRVVAAGVRAYAASNGGMVVPSKILNAPGGQTPTWPVILVKEGFVPAPNSAEINNNLQCTVPGQNPFRCPSGMDALAGTGTTPNSNAVGIYGAQGFWRSGTTGTWDGFPATKVDCWYYWNGSDKTAGSDPTSLSPTDDVPSAVMDAKNPMRGGLDAIRHASQMVMLTDGYGYDAHNAGAAGVTNQISGRHYGDRGAMSATNVAYYDGHVDALQRNFDPTPTAGNEDPLINRKNLVSTEAPFFRLSDEH